MFIIDLKKIDDANYRFFTQRFRRNNMDKGLEIQDAMQQQESQQKELDTSVEQMLEQMQQEQELREEQEQRHRQGLEQDKVNDLDVKKKIKIILKPKAKTTQSLKRIEKGDLVLSLKLFDNKDMYYPLVYNDTEGVIAYVGNDGIYSFSNMGYKILCEKSNPYKIPIGKKRQPEINITYSKSGNKICIVSRIMVAIALNIKYVDTKNIMILFKDDNWNNSDISNLLCFSYENIETHNFPPLIVNKIEYERLNSQQTLDIVKKMVDAGCNQKMPTDRLENDNFYPLFDSPDDKSPILFVGRDGILSLEEYAKKIAGGAYSYINPFVGSSDGYMMVSTKKNQKEFQYRLHRLKVCVALNVTNFDIGKYHVDHVDQDNLNNSINNLHLLTSKDHCNKTTNFNRHKFVDVNKFNFKPVELIDIDKDEVLRTYINSTEAAKAVRIGKIKLMRYIKNINICTYEIDGVAIKCKWQYGDQLYTGKVKKLENAKIWYDLVHPDTGTKYQGYKISDNLILQLPTGRYTEGTCKTGDKRRFYFSVLKNRFVDTRWGEASKQGKAIPKDMEMAHNNNQYDNVSLDTLRLTTHSDNMNDSTAKKVIAINDKNQESVIYDSIKLAADAYNIPSTTLATALREGRAKYNGVTFKYYKT